MIGARAAGSPTAMLLARRGFRVLLVDRVSFPSDTLSTHLIQLKGMAALKRWGLLERVEATNCPPVKGLAFHQGRFTLKGSYFPLGDLRAVLCPRRTVLDKILVEAAVDAGVELRQDFIVEDLIQENGMVVGLRGRTKAGATGREIVVEETARLVIGADGKHSLVASQVQAPEYHVQSPQCCAYYVYWDGLRLDSGELYTLEDVMAGLWPTNDGQAVIFTGYPIAEFDQIRSDLEGRFWQTMEAIPGLKERLQQGTQAGRFQGSADLPGFYRRPFGPGWALVGDAGSTVDPVTGQGIGNAFRDAERLAEAVDAGLSGSKPMVKAMAKYERERNADTLPMYDFTNQVAAFQPVTVQQEMLMEAIENEPAEVERFFGMLADSVPVKDFFSVTNLLRMLGASGMAKMILAGWKGVRREKASASL